MLYCPLSCASLSPRSPIFSTWALRRSFSHCASAQHDPTIPSSALLAPPASSLCLDANEEIDLRAIGLLDCLTLQLCQMNQT